jgi:tRNA (guanine37-N1)-methyltransferase
LKQIGVITPVPEIIETVIQNSILRRAIEQDVVRFHIVNLRDFAAGNYRQIDDEPYGGGSGMVLMPEPLFKALDHLQEQMAGEDELRVIYPSPQGALWNHELALENSRIDRLIFICGHYKGIDQRVIDTKVTHEYSLGDYVVSGGELATLVMLDGIVRLIPGVLNTLESALSDSFADGLLDAPWYTRPREIRSLKVPEVLLSGHHQQIEAWRRAQREQRTRERRPDLWEQYLRNQTTSE